MNSLIWGNPQGFLVLLLVPVLAALFFLAERKRAVLLARLVAARLQSALAGNASFCRRRVHFALLLLAFVCFAVALARPQYGFVFEEAKRKGREVLVAIDTSRSMLATDVTPSRLERTKLAVLDLLNALEGDRAGLIAFAGSAFLQAPLTVDYQAVEASLQDLDTNVIPLGGTNIAESIRAAEKAFGKGESQSRCLILFTDGEDLEQEALEAARKVNGSIRIFTVGVGSTDGSLISVPGENGGTEFVRDESGNFVKSRLDEGKLREIAEATGGFYIHLENGPADMRRLVQEGLGKLKEAEIDERLARKPIERYQWPLGAGLILLIIVMLLSERRRATVASNPQGGNGNGSANGNKRSKPPEIPATALAAILAAVVFASASSAHAAERTSEELFKAGKYEEAKKAAEAALAKQPDSPGLRFNKGAAEYALGNYDAAVDEFSRALATSDTELRSKAEYNLGTALLQRSLKRDIAKDYDARKGDLTNSIQHFDEALKLNPKHADARENQLLARQELVRPKPTPPPKQKKDKKKKDKKDDKKDDQKDQSQQDKDQQSQDQKDQQQQEGKDGEQKEGQSKDEQEGEDGQKDEQAEKGENEKQDAGTPKDSKSDSGEQSSDGKPQGTPAPPTEEKKLSGEIKANESGAQQDKGEQTAVEEAAALEMTGTNGEMSKNQARMLLDSLKSEDVQPFKPQQRPQNGVLKDW